MRLGWAPFALLGLAAAAWGGGEPPAVPQRLEEVRMPAAFQLSAGPHGVVTGWDVRNRRLAQWDEGGKLVHVCALTDVRLPHEPAYSFAGRPGKALLAYFDFAAGCESARQLVLVDLDRCRVERLFALEGVAQALVAAPGGWVVTLLGGSVVAPTPLLVRVDDHGREVARFEVVEQAAAIAQELGLPEAGTPRGGRPLVVGEESWFVPDLAYELWRPAQRGKPFRRLQPPPCLAATARLSSAEESAARALERAKLFPEPVRRAIERQAAAGTLGPIVQRPTRGLAARGTLVAVQLTDPRVEGGARLDLWDVSREELLAIVPAPASAGLLALGDGFAWLTQEGELLRRLPLPQGVEPLADPCAALERPSDGGAGPFEPASRARQP